MTNLIILEIIAPVTLLAGFVRGVTGFAGPLIIVPVLGFFYSPTSAIATAALVDLSSNVSLLRDALRQASRMTVVSLIGGALITVPLGGYALLTLAPQTISRTLYAVVGILSLVLLLGWRYKKPLSATQLVCLGAGSGVILGATSLGVTVMPFLYSGVDSAARSRANFILWALFCALVGVAIVFAGSEAGSVEIWRAMALIPFYVAGTYVGNRYSKRIDDKLLRRVVLWVLLATAIAGLIVNLGQASGARYYSATVTLKESSRNTLAFGLAKSGIQDCFGERSDSHLRFEESDVFKIQLLVTPMLSTV